MPPKKRGARPRATPTRTRRVAPAGAAASTSAAPSVDVAAVSSRSRSRDGDGDGVQSNRAAKRPRGAGAEAPAVDAAGTTEADLRLLHGSLTQLNRLYAPLSSSSTSTDDDEESGRRVEAEAVTRWLRRLQQLPAPCLPLYTRLCESGVAASDRAFASIAVRRATAAEGAWRAAVLAAAPPPSQPAE